MLLLTLLPRKPPPIADAGPVIPVADFSGTPLSGTNPLSVTFTDLSTNFPTSWQWEKNSGAGWTNFTGTPTAQNPVESFTDGTWSVRLNATNAAGTNVKTRTDYVFSESLPVADFSGTPLSGLDPLSVTFTDLSTNSPTSWLWEKNSGGGWGNFATSPFAQNPVESFVAGTWSVRMTSTNIVGSDTKTRTNYIASSSTIALTGTAAAVSGTDITITATSTGDISSGVYGIEYGQSASGVYDSSKNVPGAVASQSIVLGALDGTAQGTYWSTRDYYNLDAADPVATRVYGTALISFITDTQWVPAQRPLVRTMPFIWLRTPVRRNQQIYPQPDHGDILLTGLAATISGTDVTVTASTNRDLTNAKFGVEFGVGAFNAPYGPSKNITGGSFSQSITIGAQDGVVGGTYLVVRGYYNLNEADPVNTRSYSDTSLTLFVPEFFGGDPNAVQPLVRCFQPFMGKAPIRRRQNSLSR